MKIEFPNIIDFETKKSNETKEFKEESPQEKYGHLKPLLVWEAPSRNKTSLIESRASRSFLIVGIVVGLLLIMMREYFLILMVGSLVFFYYALSKSKPAKARYEINTHGIMYDSSQYYWHQLKYFYFKNSGGVTLLCIDTTLGVPARIFINIGKESKKGISELLSKHIQLLDEEPKDRLSETYNKVLDKFNLE